MENSSGFTVRAQPGGWNELDRVWAEFASSSGIPDPSISGRDLASRINAAEPADRQPLAVARAVYGSVQEAEQEPDTAGPALARLSEFLVHAKPSVISEALRSEQDPAVRRAFLERAARALSIPAVLRVALAAAGAFERPLSAPMRDLLVRVGRVALTEGAARRAEAEGIIRAVVAHRLEVARRPAGEDAYDTTLRAASSPRVPGRVTPEADRIIQLALETGATGELLWLAVAEMIQEGRTAELFDFVKRAPDTAASSALARRIATPAALGEALARDPVDFSAVDLMVSAMGIAATKPLVEALVESRVRATRRGAYERLATLGPEIAPLIAGRLKDTRWFVVRNVLSLLREVGADVEPSVAERFVGHTDPRVRREAMQLLLRNSRTRDDALLRCIRDVDPSVIRAGLQHARENMTETVVPVLAKRITETDFPPEFRVMALELLGRSTSTLALDALLDYASAGTTLLGKARLAGRSAELLAALRGLARNWQNERRARALLDMAERTRDESIRMAARRPGAAE
jgi:hypothetical protein